MKALSIIVSLLFLIISHSVVAQQVFKYLGQIQEDTTHSPDQTYFKDVVLGDIDNDGDLDIYLLQKQPAGDSLTGTTIDILYRNNINGNGFSNDILNDFSIIPTDIAFTNPGVIFTAKGYDGELADIDGDGNLDIVRIDRGDCEIDPNNSGRCLFKPFSQHGTVHVMWGDGTGLFEPYLVNHIDPNSNDGYYTNYDNVEVADLDGDGDLDFIVGQYYEEGCNLIIENRGGRNLVIVNSDPSVGCQLDADLTHTISIGDFNDDNNPDVILGKQSRNVEVYKGTGTNFEFTNTPIELQVPVTSGFSQRSVITISQFADVNQDGYPDIVTGRIHNQSVFLHDKSNNDNPYTIPRIDSQMDPNATYTYDARVADVNNNLKMDVISVDHGRGVEINVGMAGVPNPRYFDSHLLKSHTLVGNTLIDQSIDFVNTSNGIVAVSFGDMDNDGDLDMITGGVGNSNLSSQRRSAIHIYENISDTVDIIQSILNVGQVVIHKGREVVQRGHNRIEVDDYKINSEAVVSFMAGHEITLLEGFEVDSNSDFYAFIDDTLDDPANTHGRQSVNENQDAVTEAKPEVNQKSDLISVYPNPFSEKLTIRYNVNKSGGVSLRIYNAAGQLMAEPLKSIPHISGEYELDIDVLNFTKGIYYYVLSNGDQRSTGQIISNR